MSWQLRRMGFAHGGGPLFDKDDDESGGGGGKKPTTRQQLTDEEIAAAVRRLADRNRTDDVGVAGMLFRENHDLREQVREMKEAQVEVPKGGIVLKKDEAAEWEAFQKLGVKAKDVETLQTTNTQLKGDIESRDRKDGLREAAGLVNYKPSVLIDLAEAKGLHVEVKEVDVTKDGKTEKAKVPFARQRDKEGKPTGEAVALTDYVKKNLPDYEVALQMAGQTHGGGPVILPQQDGGGQGTGGTDAVSKFMERQNKAASANPNPLVVAPAPTTPTK